MRTTSINISEVIDSYFSDDSLPSSATPRVVVIVGGPASGKTTFRKDNYGSGYVLIDAADIFLKFDGWEDLDFPGELEEPLSIIGHLIAQQAICERRNIVTELIGTEVAPTMALIEAIKAVGYAVDLQAITCDIEEAMRRNIDRSNDSISAYFAEHYNRQWLIDAAKGAMKFNGVEIAKDNNATS